VGDLGFSVFNVPRIFNLSASRSMVATTVAVLLWMVLGWSQSLLPLGMVFLILVFGISIIAVRERI